MSEKTTLIEKLINICAAKTGLYMLENGHAEIPVVYPALANPEANVEMIRELKQDLAIAVQEKLMNHEIDRYEKTVRSFNKVAETAMELALTQYIFPDFHYIWEDINEKGLTVENAAKICYGVSNPVYQYHSEMQDAYEQLSKWFFIDHNSETANVRKVFSMDERLYSYLQGEDKIRTEYGSVGQMFVPDAWEKELYIHQKQFEQLKSEAQNINPDFSVNMIQLQGKSGNGKRFLIKTVQKELDCPVVVVDYALLKLNDLPVARKILWYFAREAAFYDADLCFHGLDAESCGGKEEIEGFISLCIYPYKKYCRRIYVCTDFGIEIRPYVSFSVAKIVMDEPDREERIALWEAFRKDAELESDLKAEIISAKYKLSVAHIELAVEYLKQKEKNGEEITELLIGDVCSGLLPPPSQGSIRRIKAEYTLDDIKLPEQQKKILSDICNQIWQRHKVFDSWKMEQKYSYGTGVSCLFAGPPGTGKTMAAHVISTMLGLPLYRIDLSQVVDKYIGESEKRLEEIFSLAEQSNMILFFDEADSIFGKRSDVNESKDRYANTEVSYILQRIESYEGIVIMATNYKKNIDDAFMRRIRYLVEFTMPGPQMRKEIWQSCFTDEVPVSDLDFDFLANNYELAGGNIKNVVLNAVFLAASEDEPVNMIHILQSLHMERLKMGKVMIAKDFGIYGEVMEQLIKGN